ncbi:ATP-binding protein [Streptomyces neyagawaensis]|uniref:ATP-binding protein n=1 Tax=Streptomyces neyagawaensis TaxID=42238 RepID=UPI00201D2743|nr:LuxR C-terminal-related transcriptional regulator [Streptomyces neyagawaensis]MCL6736540.1 LuxR C-terminal-related transcriptional regulator [Streptomyces neyagawaensis]MDE1680934.1 LuxR C-terminal-related transcriptional regulator [Streptomyces neyagawaensis]
MPTSTPTPTPTPTPAPLPVETTSFVDRHHELAEGRRLLTRSRLVTLTGPGGVGKTRLAWRLAARAERAFPDGVRLVHLSDLHDPALVLTAAAEALGLPDPLPARAPLDAIVRHVRDRRLLLVLDNCEHLLPTCADLVAALLRGTTGVRILATSRHRLALTEEHLLEVRPLPVPDPDGDLSDPAAHPALALFADRAAAVVPGFTLSPANRASVARLCHRLDGLPLAIELAAVRLRVLGVDQLLERLDDRYRLLAAAGPGVQPRHRTLRAAVDWSHDLCTPEERSVWARASVLTGSFDLETAESVCADAETDAGTGIGIGTGGASAVAVAHSGGADKDLGPGPSTDPAPSLRTPYDVLEAVAGLVDKSVLTREEHWSGTVRYRLLDGLRHYGLDLLRRTPGAEADARRRHRDWTQRRVAAYERAWFGPGQREIAARLRADQDNLRTALEFSLTTPGEALAGLRLAGSLWFHWYACGAPGEGLHWLERALDANPEPTLERARALWVAALLLTAGGEDTSRARRLAAESRELALGLAPTPTPGPRPHPHTAAEATPGPGPDPARAEATRSEATHAEAAHTEATHAEYVLRLTLLCDDDPTGAVAHYDSVLAGVPATGHLPSLAALDQVQLAHALVLLGQTDRAVVLCEQTLRRCERHGEDWVRSSALRALAHAYTARKQWHRAESHAREALRRGLALHDVVGVALSLDLLIDITTALGARERAAVLLGGTDRLRAANLSLGPPSSGQRDGERATRRDSEAPLRRSLGRGPFERAYRRGGTLGLDELVSYALQQEPAQEPPQAVPETPVPLTARETEVALLVAEGLANQQIADRLVIARRTAEGHVERILGKLGFHNRSQIAAWATTQGFAAERS